MSVTNKNRYELAKKAHRMIESERQFLLSHIENANPCNIIEIGVAAGGATYFMYEATHESKARILSIDIDTGQRGYILGYIMKGIDDPRLRCEYGKDVSEVCSTFDETNEKFDFLVLDTAHIHPVESLNFLTILPYLTEDATVVLHDIANFVYNKNQLACKLLFDTITGKKSELMENDGYFFSNIGAFKLNADTKKYLRDVFSMLRFPWGMYPQRLDKIWDVLKRNYDDELLTLFKSAFVYNAHLLSKSTGENPLLQILLNDSSIRRKLMEFDKVYFWGFGENTFCKELVDLFKILDFPLPCEIWDINYQKYQGKRILDMTPTQPAPEQLSASSCVISTAKSFVVSREILSTVAISDCENFFQIEDLIKF